MIQRIFPIQFDNRFEGYRIALWLLGFHIVVKLAMSLNTMLNTASVATGADGIPLDRFGPAASEAVLMFFALWGLGQLALTAVAITALVRYRAMVPLVYLLLLCEQVTRRLIVRGYDVPRTEAAAGGWYVNVGLLALLAVGLVLSLRIRGQQQQQQQHGS